MWPDRFDQIVRAHLTLAAGAPIPAGDLLSDHGLDSMSTVSLLIELEEEFSVTFTDDMLVPQTFETAGALWAALSQLAGGVRSRPS
jgi:acyl carrier protein